MSHFSFYITDLFPSICLPLSFPSSLPAAPVCSSGLGYLVRLKLMSPWRTLTQNTSAWRRPTVTLPLERRTCWCMCLKEPNVCVTHITNKSWIYQTRRFTPSSFDAHFNNTITDLWSFFCSPMAPHRKPRPVFPEDILFEMVSCICSDMSLKNVL